MISAAHHQMTRSTGQMSTMPGDDQGGGQADEDAREQGDDGVPFAGQHGGGQQGHDGPQHVEDDFRGTDRGPADRFLDDGDGAGTAATEATAARLRHGETSW